MTTFKITDVQLFDYATPIQTTEEFDYEMQYGYSANLVINDKFIVQISGSHNEATFDGITDSATCFWNDEQAQDDAYENVSNSELEEALEENGFQNTIEWLEDNATEVVNPD